VIFNSTLKDRIRRIPGLIVTALLIAVFTVFLAGNEAERGLFVVWIVVVSAGVPLYAYSFAVLLPRSFATLKPIVAYIKSVFIILLFLTSLVTIPGYMFTVSGDLIMAVGIVNAIFQLLITVPISLIVYRRFVVGKTEVSLLKKELGQSVASIDMLRSQINPHFLFNALNTLYGTAIQENADRTAGSIQRLGDMMRFMLRENMQDSISLVSEIEYLENYVSLQRLRTDTSANIQIKLDVPADPPSVSIPPMLLIPFVENAFKHGISFLSPSFIKIVLTAKDDVLHFEVTNSVHQTVKNDPEKYNGGIGLDNVRQRLQLFYPGTHQLIVESRSQDFFVHLSLQLKR